MELHLKAPKDWSDLTQEQLAFALGMIAEVNHKNANRKFTSAEDYATQTMGAVAMACLLKWNDLKVVTPYGKGWMLSQDGKRFAVNEDILGWATCQMAFLSELPGAPIYLEEVDGAKAVGGDFGDEFTFDDWLTCEALWQVYQVTKDDEMLRKIGETLYRKPDIKMQPFEALSIFYWWAGLKNYCNARFSNFLTSAEPGTSAEPSPATIEHGMNAQIRALTKGDITKEALILSLPAHRALTELDALAKEYEELNQKYPSK